MALSKGDLTKFNKTKAMVAALPPGKRERAAKLLSKLEFMNAELDKLQEIIAEKGWVEEYKNGANQSGLKKCTEGEVYNIMIKNFGVTMKTLNEMLPEDGGADELEEWMAKQH